MKTRTLTATVVVLLIVAAIVDLSSGREIKEIIPGKGPSPQLEQVASFPKQQVTGVAVSGGGRVFVNFPFWSDDHTTSVVEVLENGRIQPFPDEAWNAKEGTPDKRWICVQSVVMDDTDALWVLDPAAPKMEGAVKGGPKLVKIDLKTNQPVQTIRFDEAVAPEKSYLNDVRIDTRSGHAFITESGTGAIIVADLKSGQARRLLANDPSTKAEDEATLTVGDMKVIEARTGKAPAIHADGIALDRENGWLYYHALRATTLYRIKTADLLDESLDETALAKRIQKVATTPKPDGMLEGQHGEIYLTALEENAIVRYDPDSQNLTRIFADDWLQWPDTLAWGPGGALYVTASQIHRMPKFHGGTSQQKGPYQVFKLTLPPR